MLINADVTTQLSRVGECGGVVFGGEAPKNHTPNTFMLSSYMRTYNFTGSKIACCVSLNNEAQRG